MDNPFINPVDRSIDKEYATKLEELLYNHHPSIHKGPSKKYQILVLSGGGTKGISYTGVFKALDELGILSDFNTFAGSSIGAFMLGLHVLGYTHTELWSFFSDLDIMGLKCVSLMNVISKYGLDDASKGEELIKKLISAKGYDEDITLLELYKCTNKHLIITVTSVNSMEPVYMDHKSYPSIPVYLALRMSMTLPIIFTPVHYEGSLYIDGGCCDNYPIRLFRDRIDDVLGVYIQDRTNKVDNIDNLESYVMRVINCLIKGVSRMTRHGYDDQTITLHFEGIKITDFDIDLNKKKELIEIGYRSVMDYYR